MMTLLPISLCQTKRLRHNKRAIEAFSAPWRYRSDFSDFAATLIKRASEDEKSFLPLAAC